MLIRIRSLGRSGLKVSKVIVGAMSYGSSDWQQWVLNEEEALPLLKHAYDCGINTWDTVRISSTHLLTSPSSYALLQPCPLTRALTH